MHRLSSRALASIIAMAAMTAFPLGAWLLVGPGRAASLSSANVEFELATLESIHPSSANVYPLPNS